MTRRPQWHARILALCLALIAPQLFAQSFNYAEALQKSLFFYEAQRSGDLPITRPAVLQAQDLAYASHRHSLGWHRSPARRS